MTKMLSPARLLPAAGCALLCLMLVLGYARAQTSTPAAPTIDSVTPGDTQLKVAWTAPAGETGITAYDVRHIETSEDETDDTKWTVVDNAWTSGVLEYTITGLDNGTQYDAQVRAVNFIGDGTWSGTEVGTPALPAPTISSVRADDRAVLVSWGEPTGIATGIRAYDVRYIETNADESVDSNWTVEEDAWEDGGGSLTYAITGLTNDTEYDVQVRAVDEDDVNGAWSTTSSATPEDHGNNRTDATSIATDARIWGALDPTDDEDYFRFTVSGTADYWIYTLGDLDTVGELLDSNGDHIASDDYGAVLPNPDNFFLWRKLQSGAYYIKVTGFGSTDEPYVLRVRRFTDTTSRSNSATLNINGFASGTIDPEDDGDYFKLMLSETTEVVIRASGFPDTVGELQNSGGGVIASNDDGYLPGGRRNFLIRESLRAGTYYVKVSSFAERSDGPYTVYVTAITEPGSTTADAQALTLGDAAGGIINPAGDEDYFSLTLDDTTYVIIGGVSEGIDLSGELLDSNNLQAPVDSIHFGDVFIFQGRLDAGTYYLKVAGKDGTETGRYTVRAIREGSYTYFINRCSSISRSSGINDTLYGCQWHLNNDDQFRNSAGQDIRVEEVWPTYTGDGINVAVVDDGMHYNHEDLTGNVLTSFNHNYDPDQTDIYNYFEDHGTAVAGLIAAKDNSLGMRGVAPEANIYGYNLLVEHSDANEADAMSRNSATTAISNNSWGPKDYGRPQHAHELWEASVEDGVTNGYGGKGVVYVWAAGNGALYDDRSGLDEYSSFYAVTAVCAVGHDDKRSSYSEPGSNLWVCGPSSSGRVGQPRIATTDNGNRYRGSFGGTSAATPIVSGVVALVREANNALTWRDVKLILAASARKNDPDNTGWEQGALKYGSTTDRYNYNDEYGFGMVDAKAVVDLASGWINAPELREITSESATINLAIPDAPSSGSARTVSTSLTIDPYVEFIEFVEINTNFSHTNFRDLTVELVSPSGAVSTLSNSAPIGGELTTEFRFGSARHLGENAAGEWTLRVKDVLRRDSGTLKSWGLTIYGHGSIPGAPDIDAVTPGGGTLIIDWKEPTVTGATAITSYDLRYIREDATDKSDDNWTLLTDVGTPGNLSHTITGLTGGVKYEYQIRAHNDSGHGPWSNADGEEPTTVAPSAPSITSITRGDRTLAVVWTAPADTGGGGITAYDVRYIETSADETVDANWTVRDNAWRSGDLGYVIRSLTNTTEYDVQVRAVNRAGDGHWSETETGTPLPDDIPIRMQWDDTTPDVDEDARSVALRAVFTTTLDAPPAADFEFDLVITTTALRATQDDDYTPPPSSANFVASDFSQIDVNGQQRYQATRDFTAVIIDDTEDESTEDFRVTMNYLTPGLSHLQGGPQSATVTIRDNEHVPVTISWEESDITVDEDDGTVTLRAFAVTTVDKRPEDGFSFDASIYTSNGSALQPGDYTQLDDTVTFDRSDFSRVTINGDRRYRAAKQIVVNIEDDTVDEIEEDFTVTFEYSNSSLPHLQGGPAVARIKIADNDYVPVTISWQETNISVREDAGSVTLRARATTTEAGRPLSDFSFDVRISTPSGSARQNSDYTSLNATETFLHSDFSSMTVNGEPRYRAEKQITIDILDDIHREGDEVFTTRLAYASSGLSHLLGSPATATITIKDDEGQDPTISTRNPPSTYRENGTSTVYTFRASDPQEGPITWSLLGDDGGDFTLTEDSNMRRVLAFSTPPDYENPSDLDGQNDYELTIVVTDEDGNDDRFSFTITVTNVDEGPEITRVGSAPGSVSENYDHTQILSRYTATDPEDPSTPITGWRTSGTDGGDFVISVQGELRFRYTPDYERPADSNRDNVYVFIVQASDGRVYGSFEETVTVTPVNEPPTITTTSSSATALRQNENQTLRLYTYRATDPERGDITWLVIGTDARFFAIDERGQFSFREENPPDFEQPGDLGRDNVYDVTIQARDDAFNTSSLPVTVTVRAVNEGPEVTSGQSSFAIDENQNLRNAVYSGFDPEGGTVTRWSVGGRDGGDFTITQEGVLTFRSLPDYERPVDSNRDNVYELQVRPYDGRYYGSFDVTVTVNDVNEPPTITTTSTSATTLRQNENQTSRLYTYRAADPEGGTVTWSVAGTDGRFFAVDERGQFSFKEENPPDFEQPGDLGRDNVYDVTIQARDDGGNTASLPVTVTVREVNEGPEVTSGRSSFTINENQDLPGATYTATDPEGGSVTRWSLGGSDGGDFTITQDGELTFRNLPDYDRPADSNRDNVYELQVRPYDGRYYGSFDVTVTVSDVNEPPTITTTSSSSMALRQRENLTNHLYTYRATDPEGSTVTWSVGGTDGRFFAIDERGQFSFRENSPPDFEQPGDSGRDNVYDVTIQARDDGSNTASLPVTVTVNNDAEGVDPTISTRNPPSTYRENGTSTVYTFRASDPQRQSIKWSLEGEDRGDFTLTEDSSGRSVLSFSSPPDYESPADSNRGNDYELTVIATDEDGDEDWLSFTISVTAVDEGPEVSGPSSFTIAENGRLTNAVYTATDPEGGHIARWSVGSRDGGDFFITQGGTLYFRSLPDYDRPADSDRDNVYEITIQPSDGRVLGSYTVTVTVTDVNEPPEIRRGSATSFTQPENRTSRLYTYSATDPEGSAVTWSAEGADGRLFTIDERGQFSFREDSPPDFDSPGDVGEDNLYNVTIQARDPESNTATLSVTVRVTEVNEGPVITRQGSAPGSVPENHGADQVLATYTAADPERPSVRITGWSTSGTDGGDFMINALGELRFRNSPDYERPADSNRDNVYEVTIRASDGRNTGTLEEIQVVTITDVNEPPTITTTGRTAFSQPENRTSNLYTFRATDPEGGTVTWTAGGTDGRYFAIDEQGRFSFREDDPPDFDSPGDADSDNVYDVTVQARDPESNTSSLDVVVTVTDHNENVEPTISTRRPPTTYRENGTSAVYTFRASDPQSGTTITWSLTGTDAGDFTITTDGSGRGVLAFASSPDFENPADSDRDNSYESAVVATDDEGNTDRVDFTITVTNHNEGVEPTISTRRPPSTYRENGTSTIYTFRASDPQSGTTISWSLTGTDAGDFTITVDTSGRGVLTFNSPPDFESPADSDQDNAYELAMVAADGDGNSDRVDFTVTVTDVNEPPVVTLNGTTTTTVPENTADTQVLARYTARDPENPTAGIYRWSTTGRDGGDFVVSALGELRFRSSPDFERPADSNRDNVYEVTVRASDGSYYGMPEETLNITVTQVNEPPVITTKSRTEFSLRENSTSTIYTYRATDQDDSDTIRWSVEGADGDDFAIHNGMLTFRLLPDLENPVDADEDNVYEITVVASDQAGLRDTVNAVITITDQSEGPVVAGRTSYTVAENYDISQVLGSYTATDAKDGRAVYPQWSLSGRDGGDFVIDRSSGALTFRNAPDYDRPADSNRDNVYEVTVRGHDSQAYGDLNIKVTVTNINEAAPVVAGRNTHTVRENITSAFYSFRATDPDLNDTIAWSAEGTDGEDFTIDGNGDLAFTGTPDYESPVDSDSNNVYALTVVATDGGGLRGTFAVVVNVTELNEGPLVSGTATFTVNENRDLSGATYTAADPEATGGVSTTITWSVSGRDGGDFTIDRETGVLIFRTLPDHERPADGNQDNEYEVTVRAHDGRNYGTFDVTVTVLDVSELSGPSSLDRSENFTGVLATYSVSGQGDLVVEPGWRLSGTDGGDFNIDEQGQLTFRYSPDHERPADSNRDNVYDFVVQVSDGSYYETLNVTVTVTPVNEPPAITGRDSLNFRENTPVTTRLYTYSATDPEGEDFTWHLGGLDTGDFAITSDSSGRGVLTFASPPNFDSPAGSGTDGNEYLVTVQARDNQGNTGELPVSVAVTDQNEGATVSGRTEIAVEENRDPTLVLATYSATDPEGQAITRWSLSGSDSGDFSISESHELTFRNTPDFDRPADSNRDNEYLVTVRAYDGSAYGNLDVTVTVSNQNEHDPVIRSGSRASFSYREEGTSTLYTYSATDQDKDDTITWTTTGTDAHLFEFDDRNALEFREPPDYEDARDAGRDNEYEITVVATDSGGLSDRLDVTITVTAVDEGPEITGRTTYTVAEGQELVGAFFSATDPEDPTIEVTNWRTSGTDGGDFTMSEDGELSFRSTPDYERPADSNRDNVNIFTVQVSDGRNYGSLEVSVTVTDLNETNPEVSGRDALSVRENTTSTLYTYSARDMDRDAEITWSVRGNDSDDFGISETGELSFSSNPNHEQPVDSNSDNVYEITVVASDGQNEGTLEVTVTVTEVNEGPEISGRDTLTVSENYEAVLAAYSATDPEDTSAEITRWSVTGQDGGDFTINEDGELTFRNPPDYERPADSNRDNEYEVTVRASDGQVYGTFEVMVTVEAVDEVPEFQSNSRDSFSYRENGTSDLYTYRATDPEGADVSWSHGGTDDENFAITTDSSGRVVLSFVEPPDYDDPADDDNDNEYEVTVVATDQTGHAANLAVTVTVTDVNEGPVISGTDEFTVRENHDGVLRTYTGRDPDDPILEVTNWRTSGTDGGDFTMSEDGELSFRSTPDYERPADSNRDNEYVFTVQVSDGRYYGSFDVTVNVEAVNEPPGVTGDEAISHQENSDKALETYRATDPEGTDITWGLSGTDSSAFAISETGVLTFLNALDYEDPADSDNNNVYEVTVEATDEDGVTGRLEVEVTVTNVTD